MESDFSNSVYVKRYLLYPTIFFLTLWGSSCALLETIKSQIPTPQFSMDGISIKDVNLTDMTLLMDTSVKNPYPISLPTSKLGVDVLIEGMKLSHIDTDLGAIEGKSTKSLPMDIKLKYTDLLRFYKKFPQKEALDLQLKGDLKLPIPQQYQIMGQKEVAFPVDLTKAIPSLNPNIEISNFSVTMPDLKSIATQTAGSLLGSVFGSTTKTESPSIETSFDVKFINQNPAKFLLNNLKFDMDLDGNQFFSGQPKEIIQEGNSNIVKIKTAVPMLEAGTSLVNSLKSKKANYEIKGLSGISFPGIQEIPANFNYAKKGNLSW